MAEVSVAIRCIRDLSSVGRASARQAECRWFDPGRSHHLTPRQEASGLRLAAASWGSKRKVLTRAFRRGAAAAVSGPGSLLEGWLRGRKQLLAKEPGPQGPRGFESHSFRHTLQHGLVAKWTKAAAFYSDHRGFESHPTHHFSPGCLATIQGLSSAGRAPLSHGGGRRFDPGRPYHLTSRGACVLNCDYHHRECHVRQS